MPKATVDTTPQRKELKSLEGGYVVLRKLGYGARLDRRDKASRMVMEIEQNQGRGRSQRTNVPNEMRIEMLQKASRVIEFSECIIDHNLEDDNGQNLNFANPMALEVLDPTVGEEIERLIDELHPEANEDFTMTSSGDASSSTAETSDSATP